MSNLSAQVSQVRDSGGGEAERGFLQGLYGALIPLPFHSLIPFTAVTATSQKTSTTTNQLTTTWQLRSVCNIDLVIYFFPLTDQVYKMSKEDKWLSHVYLINNVSALPTDSIYNLRLFFQFFNFFCTYILFIYCTPT